MPGPCHGTSGVFSSGRSGIFAASLYSLPASAAPKDFAPIKLAESAGAPSVVGGLEFCCDRFQHCLFRCRISSAKRLFQGTDVNLAGVFVFSPQPNEAEATRAVTEKESCDQYHRSIRLRFLPPRLRRAPALPTRFDGQLLVGSVARRLAREHLLLQLPETMRSPSSLRCGPKPPCRAHTPRVHPASPPRCPSRRESWRRRHCRGHNQIKALEELTGPAETSLSAFISQPILDNSP